MLRYWFTKPPGQDSRRSRRGGDNSIYGFVPQTLSQPPDTGLITIISAVLTGESNHPVSVVKYGFPLAG